MVYVIQSPYTNIYENLALEEYYFQKATDDILIMLWRNEDCVVIGKNQCAETECRLQLMEKEHVLLARRTTGGGAVFHDLGNINYSFICRADLYDENVQIGIIIGALARLGITVVKSGRNDLVTQDGYKISGTAFRQRNDRCLQHGTLMINVDIDKLVRYLSPTKQKLASKGIASVRSRVHNLTDYKKKITVKMVVESILIQTVTVYGELSESYEIPSKDRICQLICQFQNPIWNQKRK